MSPDSALGQLSQRLARLEQRVDDLASRAIERFGDLAELVKAAREDSTHDYEAFKPMLLDHADMRADMRHMTVDVGKLLGRVEALEARLDTERQERIAGQADRKRELEEAQARRNLEIAELELEQQKRFEALQARADQNRLENRRMLFGLLGIFLTALAAVLAPILSGGAGP